MRFLLVEDRGDYTTNYSRKFADKDHQATIQNLSETLDDDTVNITGKLSEVKSKLEETREINYEDLQGAQRDDFILDVIKNTPNKNTLAQARLAVVNAIKDSNWDKDITDYLDNLPDNVKISNPVIELTTNLINDKKLDFEKNKDWLFNKSLYDRDEEDTLYAIKAFTLINNPRLQKTQSGEEIFTNKIKTEDFFEKDGKIINSDRMKDLLNKLTNPEVTIKASTSKAGTTQKDALKKALKDKNISVSDTEIDTLINKTNERIKSELVQALTTLKWGTPAEIKKVIEDNFEEGQTTETLLDIILKGR